MIPVKVRNLAIGEGRPKICVPIVAKTREAIVAEAERFCTLPVDLVEWRADWYEDVFDIHKTVETAECLRKALGELPLLFTFRTAAEGGEKAIEPQNYGALLKEVARCGAADLIDVELFTGDAIVSSIIETAHGCGVKVIGSNHDFQKTPPKEELIARMCKMRDLGADIPKIAVMPQTKADVLTLLAATLEMSEHHGGPIITMSMSGKGVISRLAGETFGAAVTFGSAGQASAPGQIGVDDLEKILEIIHCSQA